MWPIKEEIVRREVMTGRWCDVVVDSAARRGEPPLGHCHSIDAEEGKRFPQGLNTQRRDPGRISIAEAPCSRENIIRLSIYYNYSSSPIRPLLERGGSLR